MIRITTFALAFAALGACSQPENPVAEGAPAGAPVSDPGQAAAQTLPSATNGSPAGAEATITAWARAQVGSNIIEPVTIFYGDFTGDNAPDALAWVDYDSGGSSANHLVALFRNAGGRMAHLRNDETVYGSEPRDVVFAAGRITLTTTMPRPGDPHCCPTGSEDWTINAN